MEIKLKTDGKEQEIAWYKAQLNDLSGAVIGLQYKLAEMSNEIIQMKKGLELIADLNNFHQQSDVNDIYQYFTEHINIRMQMDRSLVLKPIENSLNQFKPFHCSGYSNIETARIQEEIFSLPGSFLEKKGSMLFNSETTSDSFTDIVCSKLRLNYFILSPVLLEGKIISFLVAGRKFESQTLATSKLLIDDVRTMEAIAGIIAAIRNQYEKFRMLDDERTRIAREMHDDIGSELTRIRMLSYQLKNHQALPPEQETKLEKISEAASKVFQGVNEIIWTMNSSNDTLDTMMAYIRRYTSEYLEGYGISYKINFQDELPDITVQHNFRRNIFLTVKEALHNIIKHAKAANASLGMKYSSGTFIMEISDDGRGINRKNKAGIGLNSMNDRIKSLGGSVEVLQREGGGTSIILSLNLATHAVNNTTFM
jgi:signal transduction histidine kinase